MPAANRMGFLLTLCVSLAAAAPARPQTPATHEQAAQLIAEARTSFSRVRDYMGTLVKQERVNGQLLPEQFIDFHIRQQPFSVHLKFTAPKQFAGQEAFFVVGKNNNEMKAKGTGLAALAGFVSLPTNGPVAMKNSRHSITETGIGNLIETIARSYELERQAPTDQVKVTFADYAFQQRTCTRIEVTHLTNTGQFYSYRIVIYIDKEMKLPVRFEAYDWPTAGNPNGDLLECYSYINLKFNVGLTDAAFGY